MKLKAKHQPLSRPFPEAFQVVGRPSHHGTPTNNLLSQRGGLAASFPEASQAIRHLSPHVSPTKNLMSQRGGLAASFPNALQVTRHLPPHVSPPKSLMSQGEDLADFADSPVSRLAAWNNAVKNQPGIYGCTVATQTTCHHEPANHLDSATQTSPRHAQDPLTLQDLRSELRALLTLQDLRSELRALVIAMGF